MTRKLRHMAVIAATVLLWTACVTSPAAGGASEKSAPAIRFGTLPVLQALPVFLAAEKGFFDEQGLNVTLVPFSSAMEKDVALTAGEISGYFGDMMTVMMLNANRVPVKIIATIFNADTVQRLFAVVSAPGASVQSLGELATAGIAISSNTIIEYISTRILASEGIDRKSTHFIEARKIPIRLQMLLSGQVPGATLPEPLVSLAVQKGGRVLADDTGKNLSAIILAFRTDMLTRHPDSIRKFMTAIAAAGDFINHDPEAARPVMNTYCRIPRSLQKTFPVPRIPAVQLPGPHQVRDVAGWLQSKKLMETDMTYDRIIADGYLP